MGWIQERPGRRPRAAWREDGKIRYATFPTVEECEQHLRVVEGHGYVLPEQRHPGRPAKGRRHRPSLTGYVKHGCRCRGCKKIYSENKRAARERRRTRGE